MNYSLATPCFNCSHPANVHVVDPVANEEHGKKCVTCSCVDFQPRAGCSDVSADVPAEKGARHQQVGGDHYRVHKIQPWQIWEEYGLDPWQANALKYLLRAGHKEGVKASEDYRKAIHYLQYLVERAGREESGNG